MIAEQPSNTVVVERHGAVGLIVLNRPHARNALNAELAVALCEAVEACQDARAIVITGADPAFCAGLDLRDLGVESIGEMPHFSEAVARSAVPVIAAVNGPAVTGGFELALAADFIVASRRAAFADTHLRVGVYPGPVLVDLPRRVGSAWAREISLTGNFVDAATALRIGIANHVVPHEELRSFSLHLAHAITEQDRDMVARMRRDWDDNLGRPIEDARRVHDAHRRSGGFGDRGGSDLAARREEVLARSRAQRVGMATWQAGGDDPVPHNG